MTRRPFDAEHHEGPADEEEAGEGVSTEEFREAMSFHGASVTVVAVRDGPTTYGTTVTSFASVSAKPPVIMVAFGGGAQVVPFLKNDARFVVNLLRPSQKRLATVYADAFPVGPSPFPPEGDPVIEDGLAYLVCTVREVVPVDGARVVLGTVIETKTSEDEGSALLHYRRNYHTLP